MRQDLEYLKLLSVFHYVVGGLAALFACFPIVHLIMGIVFIVSSTRPDANGDAPPALIGWIFVGVAGIIILIGWSIAVCIIIAGRFLAERKRYMFCLVMAGIECLFMPFGTVLGVFTIIVLTRESVKAMFTAKQGIQPTSQ
jgi:hypothetical protein